MAEAVPTCPAQHSRPLAARPGCGDEQWLPEPEKALFHQGLVPEQRLQPLVVPGAFQEVQVADVLRTEDAERSGTAAARLPLQTARRQGSGRPPHSCPESERSAYPPQTPGPGCPAPFLAWVLPRPGLPLGSPSPGVHAGNPDGPI